MRGKSHAKWLLHRWGVAQLKSCATGISRRWDVAQLKSRKIEMLRNLNVAQMDVALERNRANGIFLTRTVHRQCMVLVQYILRGLKKKENFGPMGYVRRFPVDLD